jgi:hypothetical protein
MTTDDAARLHLLEQARSARGAEAADTLMSLLPHPAEEPATKTDLALLRSDVTVMEANLRAYVQETVRSYFFATMAMNATMVALVFAAVRLA